MDTEILATRTNVEPLAAIENHATNPAAPADPIRQDRNVGNVFAQLDPLENRARPDADAGKIVATFVTVSIGDVQHAIPFHRDVFPEMRLAQGERPVVTGAEMLIDKRLEIDVGQDVAAVGNKQVADQQVLRVLDAAAGPEDFRLVDELDRTAAITSVRKKFQERFGPMMRVDDKRFHPGRDQVIEDECDERFLENRDERLGHIFRERSEPRPEPGAEDKSVRDHLVLRCRFDRTGPMAEETIWRGTASQLKNLGCFILCFLFCWLIVPIFIGLRRYLETKNQVFELTNERLKMTQGIFSKVTETLELYRVKDIETLQPFIYRIVGLENIKVNTSDLSSPVILLDGISQKVGFADKLRNQVEIIRAQKKVRELDIE